MNFVTWLRSEWDRVGGLTLAAVGGVLVVAGGLAARSAPTTIDALSYIATAGLIGLFCAIVGVGMFLSADLHDEWHKLDRIEAAIRGEPLDDAEAVLDLVGHAGQDKPAAGTGRVVPAGGNLVGTRMGSGSGLSAAVALNPGATRLAPVILLAPLAGLWLGVGQARSSAEFSTAGRGVWLGALALVCAGGLVALSTAWKRSRVKRRRSGLLAPYVPAVATGTSGARTGDDDGSVWVAPGLAHFHRRSCAALAGIAATAVRRDGVGSELVPCGLCGLGG